MNEWLGVEKFINSLMVAWFVMLYFHLDKSSFHLDAIILFLFSAVNNWDSWWDLLEYSVNLPIVCILKWHMDHAMSWVNKETYFGEIVSQDFDALIKGV